MVGIETCDDKCFDTLWQGQVLLGVECSPLIITLEVNIQCTFDNLILDFESSLGSTLVVVLERDIDGSSTCLNIVREYGIVILCPYCEFSVLDDEGRCDGTACIWLVTDRLDDSRLREVFRHASKVRV